MARSIGLDDLLELILDHIFAQLQPERAEVFMRCDDGSYTCVASRSGPHSGLQSLYSESLFSEVGDKAMAALVTDARSDHRFAEAESLVSAGVRSMLAAPLYAPDRALGLIVLGSNAAVRQYSEEDLELLVTLASVAALRIHNLALTQEAAERHRLERELTIARGIQVALLPETPARGRRLPALSAPPDRRGASPATTTRSSNAPVATSSSWRWSMFRARGSRPPCSPAISRRWLRFPSRTACRRTRSSTASPQSSTERTPPNRFATMFLGVLDAIHRRAFSFASAGHAPACLVRSSGGRVARLDRVCPSACMPDAEYQLGEASLETGDTLLVYSDGYTEAEGPAGEEFGQDRLAEVCLEHHALEPEELADASRSALESLRRRSTLCR